VTDDVPRTALLDISIDHGPITTITLAGDLDPATAPSLDDAVGTLVADDSVGRVVLDLSGLSFLDSSGLRVFVTAREALGARGADLALRAPSANISRLLDITGLGEVIEVDGEAG
jgi:anti-sigma B factor antagonist